MKLVLTALATTIIFISQPAIADQDQATAIAIENGATEINAAPIQINAKSPLAEMLTDDSELQLPKGANKTLVKKSVDVEITAADYISSITALKESLVKLEFEGSDPAKLIKLTKALKKATSQLTAFENARTEFIQEKHTFISAQDDAPDTNRTGH
jgi:hypothetical protein